MAELGTLWAKIKLDSTEFSKGVDKVTSALSGLTTASAAAGAAIAGLFAAATAEGLRFAAQLEQLQMGFTTLLGSGGAADDFIRSMQDFAARTPFRARYVGLADVGYPKIIVEAQENAAERREKVEQEEAQLEISRVQLERELQEQKLRRKVEVEKAEADAEVNRILAKSMTPEYVKYRELGALEKLAESDNKVFVPLGALNSIAVQTQIGR